MDFDQILFGVYPYICLTVLAVGSVVRFDREQYTWRSGSSQLLRRRQLVLGSNLFHLGILVIFGGHFIGLLTPLFVFEALGISHGAKQILAMTAGGIAGVVCLAGALILLHRRVFDARIRHNSSFGDLAILLILIIQLGLGLATIPLSSRHVDGSEMIKFMGWTQGIFTFRAGAADFLYGVPLIFKAHLVLGMTILLVFPFTRLVHMLSAPVWYLNRRGWQLVRTRGAMPHPRKAAESPSLARTAAVNCPSRRTHRVAE